MNHNDKRRVCVRWIIVKDGKLFCQELKSADGSGRGFWCTPGGGLDPLESLEDGLRRELMDETGVAVQVGRLLFVQQFADTSDTAISHGEQEQLEFFFLIENPEDFEHIDEQASHFDAEIARYGFVDVTQEHVLPKFLREIPLENYISTVSPVYTYTEFCQ